MSFDIPSFRAGAACLAALIFLLTPLISEEPTSGPGGIAVAGFLQSVKTRLGKPGSEDGFRAQVRVLLRDLESLAASRTADPRARVEEARAARDALVAGLAKEMGSADGRSRAEALVERAAKELRQARIDHLERAVICWCPEENWTRTLAGCAQGCAGEQKTLLREWIDAGATDSEVIERMVAHPKGGPKVRALPEARGANWVGYLTPVALSFAAAALVMVLLRLSVRRGKASSSSARAEPRAEDDEAARGVEKDLREMEG